MTKMDIEERVLTVAALFVETDGCYFGLDGVDPWDQARDARKYAGPYPVVAHPPCERWGRYWGGGPSATVKKILGDDAGCFKAAIDAVDKFGGVLEHPEGSHAWRHFDIVAPPRDGQWVPAGLLRPGFTCCVEQGWYGHRGRKATWLYANLVSLPELKWGRAPGEFVKFEPGGHSTEERRRRQIKTGIIQRLSKKQRAATPIPFRDLLLSIARTANVCNMAAE